MAQPTSVIAVGLASNLLFQQRVKFFMQKAAVSVIGEDGATVKRNDCAVSVLTGTANVTEMALAVAAGCRVWVRWYISKRACNT